MLFDCVYNEFPLYYFWVQWAGYAGSKQFREDSIIYQNRAGIHRNGNVVTDCMKLVKMQVMTTIFSKRHFRFSVDTLLLASGGYRLGSGKLRPVHWDADKPVYSRADQHGIDPTSSGTN